jgi:K+-transporting ATPase ATPase C chain
MTGHLRANLWLLVLTVILCCVLYPLVLWGIGRAAFPDQAAGSLVTGPDGKTIGSRLIAQPFTGDEYFQPRPSAAGYNAAASSASNWGASNPKLRARVAQALGPIVKYRSGPKKDQLVGPDIEKWFQQDHFRGQPHVLAQWAKANPSAAQDWVKADSLNGDCVRDWQRVWQKIHPEEWQRWLKDNPDIAEPKPEDLAVPFFVSFSETFAGEWPGVVEKKTADGKTVKRIEPVKEDSNIRANFFDMWLQEHPGVDLVQVPADMVMASGSGLDPHITLANAHYQLDRVADAWAGKTKADRADVRKAIEDLVNSKAETPLGAVTGVKLINVLEVNLALPGAMKGLPRRAARGGGPAWPGCRAEGPEDSRHPPPSHSDKRLQREDARSKERGAVLPLASIRMADHSGLKVR